MANILQQQTDVHKLQVTIYGLIMDFDLVRPLCFIRQLSLNPKKQLKHREVYIQNSITPKLKLLFLNVVRRVI